MLLTVEITPYQTIEIHMDKEGLEQLVTILLNIKETSGHEHLMTPSWAGNELSEEKQGDNNVLVHHIYIKLW